MRNIECRQDVERLPRPSDNKQREIFDSPEKIWEFLAPEKSVHRFQRWPVVIFLFIITVQLLYSFKVMTAKEPPEEPAVVTLEAKLSSLQLLVGVVFGLMDLAFLLYLLPNPFQCREAWQSKHKARHLYGHKAAKQVAARDVSEVAFPTPQRVSPWIDGHSQLIHSAGESAGRWDLVGNIMMAGLEGFGCPLHSPRVYRDAVPIEVDRFVEEEANLMGLTFPQFQRAEVFVVPPVASGDGAAATSRTSSSASGSRQHLGFVNPLYQSEISDDGDDEEAIFGDWFDGIGSVGGGENDEPYNLLQVAVVETLTPALPEASRFETVDSGGVGDYETWAGGASTSGPYQRQISTRATVSAIGVDTTLNSEFLGQQASFDAGPQQVEQDQVHPDINRKLLYLCEIIVREVEKAKKPAKRLAQLLKVFLRDKNFKLGDKRVSEKDRANFLVAILTRIMRRQYDDPWCWNEMAFFLSSSRHGLVTEADMKYHRIVMGAFKELSAGWTQYYFSNDALDLIFHLMNGDERAKCIAISLVGRQKFSPGRQRKFLRLYLDRFKKHKDKLNEHLAWFVLMPQFGMDRLVANKPKFSGELLYLFLSGELQDEEAGETAAGALFWSSQWFTPERRLQILKHLKVLAETRNANKTSYQIANEYGDMFKKLAVYVCRRERLFIEFRRLLRVELAQGTYQRNGPTPISVHMIMQLLSSDEEGHREFARRIFWPDSLDAFSIQDLTPPERDNLLYALEKLGGEQIAILNEAIADREDLIFFHQQEIAQRRGAARHTGSGVQAGESTPLRVIQDSASSDSFFEGRVEIPMELENCREQHKALQDRAWLRPLLNYRGEDGALLEVCLFDYARQQANQGFNPLSAVHCYALYYLLQQASSRDYAQNVFWNATFVQQATANVHTSVFNTMSGLVKGSLDADIEEGVQEAALPEDFLLETAATMTPQYREEIETLLASTPGSNVRAGVRLWLRWLALEPNSAMEAFDSLEEGQAVNTVTHQVAPSQKQTVFSAILNCALTTRHAWLQQRALTAFFMCAEVLPQDIFHRVRRVCENRIRMELDPQYDFTRSAYPDDGFQYQGTRAEEPNFPEEQKLWLFELYYHLTTAATNARRSSRITDRRADVFIATVEQTYLSIARRVPLESEGAVFLEGNFGGYNLFPDGGAGGVGLFSGQQALLNVGGIL